MDSGFGSVVVVDNLPKVPKAKHEKLATVLKKIFGQARSISHWFPYDRVRVVNADP